MSRPYKEVKAGEPILAQDWNAIQSQIHDHILTHTHTGTGEAGAKIDVDMRALAAAADMSVRKLNAGEGLTVGAANQPLLAVNPAATNQEGNYQVNIAGTLRAEQVRTGRLDGVAELAAGKLDVRGPATADRLTVAGDVDVGESLAVSRSAMIGTSGDPDAGLGVRGRLEVRGSMEVAGPATAESLTVRAELNVGDRATLGGDLNVTGTVTAAKFAGEGAFVRGMIIMWSGSAGDIPAGWALCDGQKRTPDLRNRFIMGAGPDAESGQWGEADSHTHKIAIPNATVPTTPAGAHTHGMPPSWYDRNDSARNVLAANTFNAIDRANTNVKSERTIEEGNHTHNMTVSYAEFSSGAHVGQNRPRWYALCFIIKV
jgi:hypothetical protein